MKTVSVTIKGVAPLRMNRFTDEAKGDLSGGGKRLSPEEKVAEAWARTYKDAKGKYVIPGRCIKKAILGGGVRIKVGKRSGATDLKAIMYVAGQDAPLAHSKPVVTEEVVRIPPGPKGARALKYFVVFPEWSCSLDLLITDDRFPINGLKQAIIEAGMYAGLLDGRPDYGRFILESFKEGEDNR